MTALAGLLLLTGVAIAWYIDAKTPAVVKLKISEYSVREEEFSYALDNVRNNVIQETAEEGSSINRDYWKSYGANSPTAKAVDQAIELVQKRYAAYELAAECGIVESASWESLTQRMGMENQEREQNIESGQVVYGNPNFALGTFIDAEMRSIKDSYITDKCDPRLEPSDADIQAYFDAHEWTVSEDGTPATLDQVRPNVVQEYQFDYYDQLVQERIEKQNVESNLAQLRKFSAEYLSLEK